MHVTPQRVADFWAKVDRGEPDECWEWTAYRHPVDGYGQFYFSVAHRWSWAIHHGEIPEGTLVCHRCDNPPCVNPAHLFLGSNADNMADKVRKGRASKRPGKGAITEKDGVLYVIISLGKDSETGKYGQTWHRVDGTRADAERMRDELIAERYAI